MKNASSPIPILALLLLDFTCFAQGQLPQYTQYLFNPYVINPSLAAIAGRGEVNVMYRQQWTGIEDAPKTFQADVQYPINERIAVAMSVGDDRTILLSRTSVFGTFAYKIPIADNQMIGFGASGGFLSDRIRMEDISSQDQNDPVLNMADNSIRFNGQVGMHYTFEDFYLGVSLLQLVQNKSFGDDPVTDYKLTDNMAAVASYRFSVSDNMLIQPTVAYRFNANQLNYIEGSVVSTVYKTLQLGVGYRQHFGPLVIARVIYKSLQLGYSYDFPTHFQQVSTSGSHEIQLKYSFARAVGEYNIFKNYTKWHKGYKRKVNKYRSNTH